MIKTASHRVVFHSLPYISLLVVCMSVDIGCLRPDQTTLKRTGGSSPQIPSALLRVSGTTENVFSRRELSSATHGAWQVMHGLLAYPSTFEIATSDGNTSALQYLLQGGDLAGWQFSQGEVLPSGRIGLRANIESGSYTGQGHADQWFAVLSQAEVALDATLTVNGKQYLMQDFLDQTLRDVSHNHQEEFSWTLIGLTRYLPTTATWTAADGNVWSIEELVKRELNQALQSSACGGTHRLIGLSMALTKRLEESAPMNALWQQVDAYLTEAVATAQQFQNGDGSFSSNYFARPGVSADNAKVLASTGHTLELLALTLSESELKEPWVERAVLRLCDLLDDAADQPLECGALYHAVHGLAVYQDRLKDS